MKITENMITLKGYKNVQKEILRLYQEKRPQIIEDLKVACDFGDLRENSEFDAVKEAQGKCDKRIRELESLLTKAQIIDDYEKGKVCLGSKVTIRNLDTQEEETYNIVSTLEVGLSEGNISVLSPVGKALYNRNLHEVVKIDSPQGQYQVKIMLIE